MGLFSSKYETKVATTINRVIEDHSLPNSIKHGAIAGLFQDEGEQFTENILESLVSSFGVKANLMYNYAKDHYTFGLPSSTNLVSTSGQADVQAKIAALVGQSVTMDYYHFGAYNNLHIGWVKLIADHGYNAKTNVLGTLSTAKGKPVMLTNIAVCVTDATLDEMSNGSLAIWGPSPNAGGHSTTGDSVFLDTLRKVNALTKPNPFELDPTAANDYLRVEYTWEEEYTAVVEGVTVTRKRMATDSFSIQILGFDVEGEYHQAKYTRADDEIGYWIYKSGAGTYPEIDSLHDTKHLPAGSYFPWAYFRVDGQRGNANKKSDFYKQTKKMVKYLNIDYDQVTDAIHGNPDINKVEQAMLMMGVPAVTSNQVEMRYLFDFFAQMLKENGGNPSAAAPYIPQGTGILSAMLLSILNPSMTEGATVIQDSKFKLSLGFRHINRAIVQGTIGTGKVGHYTSGWETEVITETGTTVPTNPGGPTTPVTKSVTVKTHWYRKQTTETQYEEIRVNDLKMKYWVYKQYAVTSDENAGILLIPVDRSITSRYSIPVREELYARSLHYVFNSKVVTEIKWYQKGWFRSLTIIVAIVITVLSWGSTWQTIGASLAAGTITIAGVAYMLVMKIIEQIVIAQIIKLFVKAVGVKFAMVVAIIAALAGAYQAIEADSVAGSPWGAELLQLSTGLTKGINMELQRDFNGLKKEADDFQLFVKEEQKKLDEANKLLENSNWMTPLVIFGEKPHDFYQRTVHSGNIGVLGLDAISEFVDVSLQLPQLTDTL